MEVVFIIVAGIVTISGMGIISDTIVKLGRGKGKVDKNYVGQLESKIQHLEEEIKDLKGETQYLRDQSEKLEEHYDFVNRLLEEHKG